jgi:hypothetical protein
MTSQNDLKVRRHEDEIHMFGKNTLDRAPSVSKETIYIPVVSSTSLVTAKMAPICR